MYLTPIYPQIPVKTHLYKLDGLLNWGYNFWYSQFSLDQELDPWRDTCSGGVFCGGAAFMVYPGKNGCPVDSIRLEVISHAMQDLRALQLLESKIGRKKVEQLIMHGSKKKFSFKNYPKTIAWVEAFRKRINQAVINAICVKSTRL